MILPADSRCSLPAATVLVYRPGRSDTAAAGDLLSALLGQFAVRLWMWWVEATNLKYTRGRSRHVFNIKVCPVQNTNTESLVSLVLLNQTSCKCVRERLCCGSDQPTRLWSKGAV